MNPSISKNNFFYRLAVFGGYHEYRQLTLCGLIGRVLWGCFSILIIAALIAVVTIQFLIFPGMELWFWTQHGLGPNWFVMCFPFIAVVIITGTIFATSAAGSDLANTVAMSIRDRLCVYINVREE